MPGRVEAEDYDVGGFSDATTINEGGAYRFDAVDIEVLGRIYDVGWIRSGEHLNYSVDTTAAGDFALTLCVANAEAMTKPVRVYLDGVPAGEVRVGSTRDWVVFGQFAASAPLTIPEGRHVVTIAFEGVQRMNFDWLNLARMSPDPDADGDGRARGPLSGPARPPRNDRGRAVRRGRRGRRVPRRRAREPRDRPGSPAGRGGGPRDGRRRHRRLLSSARASS